MEDVNIIELEVRLLLLKYGLKRVLQTLASIRNFEPVNIEQLINEASYQKSQKSRIKHTTIEEILKTIDFPNSEVKPLVYKLGNKFENKIFLPQLKDVRMFLEKNSVAPKSIKSRISAAKKVFELLSMMSVTQLNELLESSVVGQSDLSVISDQIVRRSPRK